MSPRQPKSYPDSATSDTRGRRRGEVANLICDGIEREQPDCPYKSILKETQAIEVALDEAPQGSLVIVLPEKVGRTPGPPSTN